MDGVQPLYCPHMDTIICLIGSLDQTHYGMDSVSRFKLALL